MAKSTQYGIAKHPKVKQALQLAEHRFSGMFRKNGKLVIEHILAALNVLLATPRNFTVDEVIAMILHDIVEDTKMTFEELEAQFGSRVAGLVWQLSRPDGMSNYTYYTVLREGASVIALALKTSDVVANLETLDGCHQAFIDKFKGKIQKLGLPLIDVIRVHGEEWFEFADYIEERMRNALEREIYADEEVYE